MEFFTAEVLFSFVTLTLLEIVLGIDNLIFIALVVQRLPKKQQDTARLIGLSLALIIRIAMLLTIAWIMSLTRPLFELFNIGFSVKDLLLLAGGLFLIAKSTLEMHHDVTGRIEEQNKKGKSQTFGKAGFYNIIFQILVIDFVFSFDSIITAVGLTTNIPVIIAAIVISMIVMLFASGYISDFLGKYPTFKMLALSFILMIGILLLGEGLHYHIERGYIYFAFAFSMFVEGMNTAVRKKHSKN